MRLYLDTWRILDVLMSCYKFHTENTHQLQRTTRAIVSKQETVYSIVLAERCISYFYYSSIQLLIYITFTVIIIMPAKYVMKWLMHHAHSIKKSHNLGRHRRTLKSCLQTKQVATTTQRASIHLLKTPVSKQPQTTLNFLQGYNS